MKMINFVMRPFTKSAQPKSRGEQLAASERKILAALNGDAVHVFSKERAHAAFAGLKKRDR